MPERLPFAVYLGQVDMVSVILFTVFLGSGQLNKEHSEDYFISH